MVTTEERLKSHLQEIVGPRYRYPNNSKAKDRLREVDIYITEFLEQCGWKVTEQSVEFDHMRTQWGVDHGPKSGKNLIARRPNEKESLDSVLILIAHHDTVIDSPGADDNGSAVSILLELAKNLIDVEMSTKLILLFTDFEEIGLVGSEYFVQNLDTVLNNDERLLGAIVLEMLGYYSEEEGSQSLPSGFDKLYWREVNRLKENGRIQGDFLSVIYNGEAKLIVNQFDGYRRNNKKPKLALIRDPTDIPILGRILKKLIPSLANLLRSDHTPFWTRDLPAIMITDTANFRNPNYHQPSDTIKTLNLEFMVLVTKMLFDVLSQF